MSKKPTSRSRREKLLHYRLLRRIYALLRDERWTIRFARIVGNRRTARRLAVNTETLGTIDVWTREMHIDVTGNVIAVLVHECLHALLDRSLVEPYQVRERLRRPGTHELADEEREVERLEGLIMRHLSPVQARRLHHLMAMRLK